MKDQSKKIIEFTILYNRYKRNVFNYSRRMINDSMVCEDVVQNTFIKLFENLDNIRNKESVNYWIFKTARNEIYSYLRKKKITSNIDLTKIWMEEDVEIEDPEKEFEQKEIRQFILSELDNMPYDQREVYILKEFLGLSYKEIADMMEIDENLVKSRLYKTRQKLIKYLSRLV